MANKRFDDRLFGAGTSYVQRETVNGLAKSITGIDAELSRYMRKWAKEYQKGIEGRGRKSIGAVNRSVAEDANEVIKDAYADIQFRGSGYRGNDGRLPGSLKRAISSTKIAKGNEQGILFLPMKELDSKAVHWRRINFGTGGESDYNYTPGAKARFYSKRKGFDLSRFQGIGAEISIPEHPMFWSSSIFNKSKATGPFAPGAKALYFRAKGQTFEERLKKVDPGPAKQFEGHHFIEKGAEYLTVMWPLEIEGHLLREARAAAARIKK